MAAGWVTAIHLPALASLEFVKGLRVCYRFKDLWFGVVKAVRFGAAVTLAGCIQGLTTRGGAEGVGRNTTRAVVIGCEAILVLDAFWALVLL